MGNVDSNTAEEIEKDMEEIDQGTKKSKVAQSKKSDTVESVDCHCVTDGWKPGLLSDRELCPDCEGTGKVADTTEG